MGETLDNPDLGAVFFLRENGRACHCAGHKKRPRRRGATGFRRHQKKTTMTFYIQIKLFASLGKHQPKEADRFPIEPGARVADILEKIGAPIDEAKLIFINHKRGELSTVLNDGDRVGVFPPVGGG